MNRKKEMMYNKQVQIAPGVCVVYTMSSTLIVPDRDIPCTQWVSFNGDNEPVLNTSPEVDDTCDTFLKRLQKAKLYNQNDPALPSGQQFCFEAMVDKRYNRWKRRRRKKQSEARRTNVLQGCESSDENDERNIAMERIIDRMYEEINGPAPHTPNGSRDTPRTRNRRRRKDANSLPRTPDEQDSSITLYDASSEWTSDGCLPSSSSAGQIARTTPDETLTFVYDPEPDNPETELPEPETPEPETSQRSQSGTLSDDLCAWPYLEQYKSEILKRLKSTPPDQLEDLDQNDWLPDIKDLNDGCIDTGVLDDDTSNLETVNTSEGNFVNNDNEICTLENYNPDNTNTDNTVALSAHDNQGIREEKSVVGKELESDADTTPDEYEPYIRVTETPRESPVPISIDNHEPSNKTVSAKTKCQLDPARQMYSYTKWSRSQRSVAKKLLSLEQKPKLLSRTSATSWREMGCDPDCREKNDSISVTDKRMDQNAFRPIKRQDIFQSTKDRFAKKNQKVALNLKKQNVNLPSLTKNSKSQTMPDGSGKEKTDKPAKVKTKPTKSFEDKPRSQPTPPETPNKGSLRESQTVPDFMLKDYYLRSLYGYKTRINSHVDPKHDKGLRKTLTVDNLELLAKKTRKKSDISKPNDLAFTRSFTFSMFDLPEVYKLYNTTLERRAAGEEIEA